MGIGFVTWRRRYRLSPPRVAATDLAVRTRNQSAAEPLDRRDEWIIVDEAVLLPATTETGASERGAGLPLPDWLVLQRSRAPKAGGGAP